MKKLILFYSFFITSCLFAQEKVEADTDVSIQNNTMPIRYAKVYFENKDYYKNTDKSGKIRLEKDEKISKISANGFEDLFPTDNHKEYILIAKKQKERMEILPKNKVKMTIAKINKKSIVYANPDKTCLSQLQYIPYEKKYPDTAFIKSISFLSSFSSKEKRQPIILRLYKNNNGHPGDSFETEDIIVECRPGKSINKVDLSKSYIIFPKEGLFIGFDWINIPSNNFKFDYKKNEDGSIVKVDNSISKLIGPSIACEEADENSCLWYILSNGWGKGEHTLYKPLKTTFEIVISD